MLPYREEVRWPGWFHGLLAVPCGLGAVAGPPPLARGAGIGDLLPPLALAAGVGVFWWKMRLLAVEVGPEGVAFGFGRARRRIPWERVQVLEAAVYPAVRFMGWGYRIGWRPRQRAYSVLGCREGLRLRFLDPRRREWEVFLSSRDPRAVIEAAREAGFEPGRKKS